MRREAPGATHAAAVAGVARTGAHRHRRGAEDEKARYTFDLDSEPAKNIRWTSIGSRYGAAYESPTLPYDKMAESAFDDFKNQLGVKLGVAKPVRP